MFLDLYLLPRPILNLSGCREFQGQIFNLEFAIRIRTTLLKTVNGKGGQNVRSPKQPIAGRFVMIHLRDIRQLCDPMPPALFKYGVHKFTSEISDFF